MVIPFNHPEHIFPLNLEDRIRYVKDKFNELQDENLKFNYNKKNNGIFLGKRNKKLDLYEVTFSFSGKVKPDTEKLLQKYNFTNKGKNYSAIFE